MSIQLSIIFYKKIKIHSNVMEFLTFYVFLTNYFKFFYFVDTFRHIFHNHYVILFLLLKKRGVFMDTDDIVGEEIGCVSIHMYKETTSNLPLFRINTDSDNVLPLSYIIEDILKFY